MSWTVRLLDYGLTQTGETLTVSELRAELETNSVHVMDVTVPATRPLKAWKMDTPALLYRSVSTSNAPARIDAIWFLRAVSETLAPDGTRTQTLRFVSGADLLRRRIAYAYAGSASVDVSGAADTVAAAAVTAFCGSTATHPVSGLSIITPAGTGPAISIAFAYRNILDTLRDMCALSARAGQRMFFDVVFRDGLEFRVYMTQRGKDLASLGVRATLSEYELTYDAVQERNYIYAGGTGERTARIRASVSDGTRTGATPWALSEHFCDLSNIDTVEELEAAAASELERRTPRRVLRGTVTEADGFVFGADWGLGDAVLADLGDGFVVTASLEHVSIRYDARGDIVTASVEEVL